MTKPSSTSPPKAKPRWLIKLAWAAVILSFPVWFAAFLVVPFLPLEAASRVALAGACIAVGEALFWGASLVLGAQSLARFRRPRVDRGGSFANKRVVVIGANGGLGSAIARALHREGASPVLVTRGSADKDGLANELSASHEFMELSDHQSIEQAAERIQAQGPIHHAVCAAGVDVRKAFSEHAIEEIDKQLTIDLRAPMLISKAFLPRLEPGGTIALLGGFGDGRLAFPYYSADVAARAGLAAFCESINRELDLGANPARLVFVSPAPADTAAERPYAELWTAMGSRPVPPSAVADFVLQALLMGRTVQTMGFSTRLLASVNALFPGLADVLVLRKLGRLLKAHFDRRLMQ